MIENKCIYTAFILHYSYFMDGRVNKVEDFLKTRLFDTLAEQLSKVTRVRMVFDALFFF